MVKISVYVCGNDHYRDEWYLFESIESALNFADEVVVVFGGTISIERYRRETTTRRDGEHDYSKDCGIIIHPHEDDGTFEKLIEMAMDNDKIKLFVNPWEVRMRNHQTALQKTLALSHCTGDVCILQDADEVFHEGDYDLIKRLAHDLHRSSFKAVYFNTIHFYRDFRHYKNSPRFYKGKPYMVVNKVGIFHGKHPDPNSIEPDAHVDFGHKALDNVMYPSPQMTPLVYHYGHVRSKKTYCRKTNEIEQRYHGENWIGITPETWDWDMTDTMKFNDTHPKVMRERIKRGNEDVSSA